MSRVEGATPETRHIGQTVRAVIAGSADGPLLVFRVED
jgi:hypothetical protein